MSIKIVLADDHQIVRHGLRSLLAAEVDMKWWPKRRMAGRCCAWSRNSPRCGDHGHLHAGLNGIEATRQIQADCPGVKVIALVHARPTVSLC